jgi:hypothetical protein
LKEDLLPFSVDENGTTVWVVDYSSLDYATTKVFEEFLRPKKKPSVSESGSKLAYWRDYYNFVKSRKKRKI